MKKIICLVVALIMIFALLGCSNIDYKEQLDNLNEQIDKLNEDLQEKKDLITSLEEENIQLRNDLSNANSDKENFFESLKSFVIERIDSDHDINNPRNQNDIISPNDDMSSFELDDGRTDIICGYRFLKIYYAIDNIKLRFYCGYEVGRHEYEPGDNLYVEVESGWVEKTTKSYHGYDNTQLVATVNDFYFRDDCAIEATYISSLDELNYYVDITIPQELVCDSEGCFFILATPREDVNGANWYTGRLPIYYKIVSGDVILSSDMGLLLN